MTKRRIGCVAVALTLLVPRWASAQAWLRDRTYTEGAGIKTGDLELHPGIAGEVGYDSNWFLRSTNTRPDVVNGEGGGNPVLGTARLRITPSLYLSTQGAQRRGEAPGEPAKIQFRAGMAASLQQLLSPNSAFSGRRTQLSAQADARLDVLPQRPLGASFSGSYTRTVNPAVVGNPDLSFNRNDVTAAGELVLTPGSGTFDWRAGYQFRTTLFDDNTYLDNFSHGFITRGSWRFRPLTALLFDGSFSSVQYSRNTTGLRDFTPIRARLGLNGLVTPRFSLLVMAGYGGSFFRPGSSPRVQQYDNVIGQAEARFFLTPNPSFSSPDVGLTVSSLAVGYQRDFQQSFLSDYYGLNRVYGRISYFFAGRMLITLDGGLSFLSYPQIFFLDPARGLRSGGFNDRRADATLFTEYRFSNSFGVNGTLRYTANFSNTLLPLDTTAGSPAVLYDMSWSRIEAFAGVRWFL